MAFGNISTYFDYLVNLEKLYFQDCYFGYVEDSPFRNLKNLNYLSLLDCTGIRPLDKSFFAGLLSLNTLDLSSIEFKKDSLSDLKNLDKVCIFEKQEFSFYKT